MKKNADLIGFMISALFVMAFMTTICITIICKIDLSIWVIASLASAILSAIIGFAVYEDK